MLLFVRDGFRPEIRSVTGSEEPAELSVVLQPETTAALTLRTCRRQGRDPLRELEAAGVRGLRLKRTPDAEILTYAGSYTSDGAVWHFSSTTGIHVGGLTPTPEWLSGLSSLTVRSLMCAEYQWFDLRGVSSDGLESRWVAYSVSRVVYSKVPARVARVFDEAIDHGCCR